MSVCTVIVAHQVGRHGFPGEGLGFESRSALLGSESPALCRDDFVVGTAAGADAIGRFFADFDIEILRSVSRRRAALPKPHLGDGAGGAGSRGAFGARN